MRLRPVTRVLALDYQPFKNAVLEAAVKEICRRGLRPEDLLVPERRMDRTDTPDAIAATRVILDQVREHVVAAGWSNAHIRNVTGLRSLRVAMLERMRNGDYSDFSFARAMQLAEALGKHVTYKGTSR